MSAPDFWNNRERAQADVEEVSRLRSLINPFFQLEREINDFEALQQLAAEETNDAARAEAEREIAATASALGDLHPLLALFRNPASVKPQALLDLADQLKALFAQRAALDAGYRLVGPAIVNQMDTTTWIPEGWEAATLPSGALVLERT